MFILLTPLMTAGIKYLINENRRIEVGIAKENPYIFARPNHAKTPIDGCEAVRNMVSACPELRKPGAIRTTKLRKYLATTVQVRDSQ